MTQAIAHTRPSRKARARLSKVASARDTIDGFGHGMDVVGLTFGQFSLLDLIEAALELTGPADVTISTWSAGFYDVEAAELSDLDWVQPHLDVEVGAVSMGRVTVGGDAR